MKKHHWISWYQPTEDHRPIMYPPNPHILGWWCTGVRCNDDAKTMAAMVQSDNENEAKRHILIDWPEAVEWRFCEEVADLKLSDRFPINNEWMKERFDKAAQPLN